MIDRWEVEHVQVHMYVQVQVTTHTGPASLTQKRGQVAPAPHES